MKKFIPFILLLTFVFSCTSNTIYKKPNDLISEDLMVDLILDMQIANGARNSKNKEGKRILEYMPLVYEKYGIDSARFAKSNFYYSTVIDDYTKILRRVKSRLDIMEKEFDVLVKIQDSLNKKEKKDIKKKVKLGTPIKLNDEIIKY